LPLFSVTRHPSQKRSGRTQQVCQRTSTRNICHMDISRGHFASEMSARCGPLGLRLSARRLKRLVSTLPSVACRHAVFDGLSAKRLRPGPSARKEQGADGRRAPSLPSRLGSTWLAWRVCFSDTNVRWVLPIRHFRGSGNARLARGVGSRVLASLFARIQYQVGVGRSFVMKVESMRLSSCVFSERSW
jgi:hypothetical protein